MNEQLHRKFTNYHPAPTLLPQTKALRAMHSTIRDRNASQQVFVHHSRRIMRLLIEQALDLLPYDETTSETPAGATYHGFKLTSKVCGVSVLRAGDSMEAELRNVCPDAPIGKILIQRDKESHQPKYYFANLPDDIGERQVLLLDPMLATGGTAVEAISTLQMHGVKTENIVFVTLLSVANGLNKVHAAFPEVRVVTSSIEEELNDNAYMLPGIGDFGDRYFGTYKAPLGVGAGV
jgi:uracil phosphoribosyltransferase